MMTLVEFTLAKDTFLEVLVAFGLFSGVDQASAAVKTSDVEETVSFEIFTNISLATS
jgi:hypothetical protein